MNVDLSSISLFTGAGGLDLGVETGLAAIGRRVVPLRYVEVDVQVSGILASRFADGTLAAAPQWSDIRSFDCAGLRGSVDLVHGGFPCQDVSVAGKRRGMRGSRSGLWSEFARVIREVQPNWVFIENVRGILLPIRNKAKRVVAEPPIARVLRDLAGLGFDAEWGGGFKDKAYDVKQWSMERAAALLAKHGHEWGIVWGWQRDPSVKFGLADSWVLYVDLPTGQCSFHTQHPGCAPMVLYKGEWDGTKKSAEHIIAFCDLVMAQPPLEVPA